MESPASLLIQSENWRTLSALQAQFDSNPVPLAEINRSLRAAGFTAELSAALTSQLELRDAGRAKFGQAASHMLFTRNHLEQATRLRVALLHARRFADAGVDSVADLGCGLGAESLALSMLGIKVIAIDRDPEAVACAGANLRDFETATVLEADLLDFDAQDAGVGGLFVDPARRDERGRVKNPLHWAPPWPAVLELANGNLPLGAKLAPGIDHDLLPPSFHTQWLSVERELVEASMWSPALAPEGPGVSAGVLTASGLHVLSGPGQTAPTGPLRQCLFEPDPAVIRAGLVGNLVNQFGGHLLQSRIAYGTADESNDSPFAQWFEVIDHVPLRVKQIRQALAGLDAGTVEVKKRGVQIDPSTLQRQLNGDGSKQYVIFATRIGDNHRAVIARRIG